MRELPRSYGHMIKASYEASTGEARPLVSREDNAYPVTRPNPAQASAQREAAATVTGDKARARNQQLNTEVAGKKTTSKTWNVRQF